jgi:hypothetical protein
MAFSSSVPVRYWRIGWGRSVSDTNSYAFEIATLQLYDSSDTHLTASGGATPPTITLSGSSTDAYDLVTYPLSNLTDVNETTHVALYSTGVQLEEPRYVEYDFGVGNEVLLDYFKIANVTNDVQGLYTNWIGDGGNAAGWDLFVGASVDGTEWMLRYWAPKFLKSGSAASTLYTVAGNEVSSINNYGQGQLRVGGGNSTGAIYGIVSEDGSVYPNRPVFLYDDATGTKIGNTFTDQYGGYAFGGLDISRVYTVVSRDFSGPPYKNALIYDRIQPVNAVNANASPNAFFELRNKAADLISFFHITGEDTNQGSTAQKWLYQGKMSAGVLIRDQFDTGDITTNRFEGSQIKTALGTYANECNFFWFPHYAKNNGVEAAYPTTQDYIGLAMPPDFPGGDRTLGGSGDAFTLELYAQMPETGEDDAHYFWGGNSLGNGAWVGGASQWSESVIPMPATARIELGGNSSGHGRIRIAFSYGGLTPTVRFDTGVSHIPNGDIVHITVTHLNKQECKLYIDGVLYSTVSLIGTADLYTSGLSTNGLGAGSMTGFYDPGQNYIVSKFLGEPLSHIGSSLFIFGEDYVSSPYTSRPNGPGGAFGHAACYGRVYTQAEVTDLYDSIADWSTMYVAPVYGGYSGEVEKDTPVWYFIGDQATTAPLGLLEPSLLGYQGTPALFGPNAPTALSTPLRGTSPSFGATSDRNGFIIQNATNNMGAWSFECFIEITQWPGATANLPRMTLYSSYCFTDKENDPPTHYLNHRLLLWDDDTLIYEYRDVDGVTLTQLTFPAFTMSLNTTYHFCITFDPAGDIIVYLDGVAVDSAASPFQWQFGDNIYAPFWEDSSFGHHYVLGPHYPDTLMGNTFTTRTLGVNDYANWRGRYSDVASYAHVLPAARVLAHYNARNS